MKKLYTLKDLKKKYDPDKVIVQIEENFVLHKYTLINLLSIDSCPLSNYKQERQLSFLETKGQDDAELIKEIAEMLKDAIYFMTLSKKEYFIFISEKELWFLFTLNDMVFLMFFLDEYSTTEIPFIESSLDRKILLLFSSLFLAGLT